MSRTAFLDEAVIEVNGGRGGAGIVSFFHTRRKPRGGPDGGNGGAGGTVYACADESVTSLVDFIRKQRWQAGSGESGGANNKHGARGGDLHLQLPVGTDVRDAVTQAEHGSLLEAGDRLLLASGGNGGRGNTTFKSSVNRTPREATPGEPGDERQFVLTLRMLADVGLIGLPNAGKSSLLNRLCNSQSPIGAYPFTTVKPYLGMCELPDYSQITMADIPGIIPGAADGSGLGLRFLRHVSRTAMLVHMVDCAAGGVAELKRQIDNVIDELQAAGLDDVLAKPRILVLAKSDLLAEEEVAKRCAGLQGYNGVQQVLAISAAEGDGLDKLVGCLASRAAMEQKSV